MTLRAVTVIARESATLLRRDRIFVPALIAIVLISAFAQIAAEWTIENFEKVLYDIGSFGLTLTGSFVALFWGAKAVSDSRHDGSLEVRLAAPVSRPSWIIGKYLGLAMSLVMIAVLMVAIWQLNLMLFGYGRLTPPRLVAFGFMLVGWLVLGALTTFLATFCGQGVALFAGASLWLAGMSTALVANTLPADTSPALAGTVRGLARGWDLQQFNLFGDQIAAMGGDGLLVWRGAYGALLILVLITLAALIFSRRDA
jgi:Cu-processing system permease protein